MNKERFYFNIVECRALDEKRIGGTASVTYDAAVPGSEYRLWDNVYERIAPHAFDRVLRSNPDVVALFNHNPDHVLGRTPLTLRLSADEKGLHYEIDLPSTRIAQDVHTSISRGDIRGSSFAATVGYEEWSREGDNEIRTIKRFDGLYDVSPVTYPAYTSSGTAVRSCERKEIERAKEKFYFELKAKQFLERQQNRNK